VLLSAISACCFLRWQGKMSELFHPHSIVGYYSMHGNWTMGLVVGYGYIGLPESGTPSEPDCYIIEIEPHPEGVLLPVNRLVAIELHRVHLGGRTPAGKLQVRLSN